jgi:hypothetical protein
MTEKCHFEHRRMIVKISFKIIIIIVIFLISGINAVCAKSFETQETVTVKAARETILEIPYNQNTTIQFPEIVRTIWTSVSTNDMRAARDKNFLQVSAKAESPITVILSDGSVYPIRLIPSKNVKTFAFNIQDTITRDNPERSRFSKDNEGDSIGSSDLILLTEQEISIFHEIYDMYYQILDGKDIPSSGFPAEKVNKTVSQIMSADVVECLDMTTGIFAGKVYEIRNNGPDIELKDDDLIPFISSVKRLEGYSETEAFFIDSYFIPAGKKTGLFVIYQK